MALSLWQGQSRLGGVRLHRVVTHRRTGYSVCILAGFTFRSNEYRAGPRLELRNDKGEQLDLCLQTMLHVPGSVLVGEFDGTKAFDWGS